MKRTYNFLLHASFWILFAILPLSTLFFSGEPLTNSEIIYLISAYLLHALNFYLAYIFFIPMFSKKRNLLLKIILSLLFLLTIAFIRVVAIKFIFRSIPLELTKDMQHFLSHNGTLFLEYLIHSFIFTAYAFLIRFTYSWFNYQNQKAELITQNQASELALLRYQINPHFLLNTLNNIYALVYKKDDKAPDAVMKLSELLHYTLYKANTNVVSLESEVTYLKSFIELQTLRFPQENLVEFDIQGSLDGKVIEPMLLLPFVENAFKHSVKDKETPGITIKLITTPNSIEFLCKNYFNTENSQQKDDKGGIGLQNIQRRLALLYPDAHELTISTDEGQFHINLKLYNK